MEPVNKKSLVAPAVSLFTSLSTLICCALPALMVTIGAGAALAGLVSAVPQLIWLSEHKVWVFSIAGFMIVLSGFLQRRSRSAPCPADPAQAQACVRLRKASGVLYWASVVIYAVGFFFAFIAARLV